jgi:hypothetical protein
MSRFKLICEDEATPFAGPSKIKHEFDSDSLSSILNNVSKFLQVTGYLDDKKHLTTQLYLEYIDDGLDEFTENLFTGKPLVKDSEEDVAQWAETYYGTK